MRVTRIPFIVSVAWLLMAVPTVSADPSKTDDVQAELKKFQGLWQSVHGGAEHQDGMQVVRNPALNGQFFFVHGQRLIWLDEQGKPTGKDETIELDVQVEPKQITLTPVTKEKIDKPSYGIYRATGDALTVHFGLDGGPAPKQFLELNKPIKGIDGAEWLVRREKLQDQ